MSSESFMLVAATFVLFVLMFALQVLGFRGAKSRAGDAISPDGLGVIEGAVFALLGLMLAFQFGGAASRLNDRREIAVAEANAIGTAYLRLDLLPAANADPLRANFKQYIDSRIRVIETKLDYATSSEEQLRSEQLQQQIWTGTIASLNQNNDREAALLLLPSLNEMIDIAAERKAVGQTHAAIAVQLFLVALALVGALLAGHSMSRAARQPTLHMLLFAAVISVTIYFIFDMEFPRLGSIQIGVADSALYDLQASIGNP